MSYYTKKKDLADALEETPHEERTPEQISEMTRFMHARSLHQRFTAFVSARNALDIFERKMALKIAKTPKEKQQAGIDRAVSFYLKKLEKYSAKGLQ